VTEFPRIVFDVDNVLADSMTIFCQKASKLTGFEVTKQNIKNHKVVGFIPLTPQTIFKLQSEVWADWKMLPSLESNLCKKMLAFQKIGFDIYVATAVPLRLTPYVKQWLKKMHVPYSKFFHCRKEYSKSGIEAEALVDDAPEEIKCFIRSGRQGFLYLQPWNININISKAIVVRNLDDVLKYYGVRKGEDGIYRDARWLGKIGTLKRNTCI